MVSWISLKSKTYALQNILLTKWKDKPQTGRKHFQQISDKDLVTKIHKVFKLNNNATNKLNLKWANYLNRYLIKENMKPKFQLVLKQPLTGGHWNPPKKKKKDTPHPKTKEKLQWDGRRGTNHEKMKTHTLQVGNPQTGEKHQRRRIPHIRLPSLEIQQRDQESPRDLTLKTCGIWLQGFHRTGGNQDSTLGGEQNLVQTRTQGKRVVVP